MARRVVRDFTIIDNRSNIDRSVIWRDSYIGEGVELRGAIVGRQCSLKSNAVVFEGVVIGDNTIVGEAAIIHPEVKIWPGKEIEAGATVKNSIIWGSQGRRVSFGRFGVTGLVNIDLTPEMAARLGAAFGATLPRGSTVTINRDPHRSPRMIKRAMISGLPSAGINVLDLRSSPIPVARFITHATEGTRRHPRAPVAIRSAHRRHTLLRQPGTQSEQDRRAQHRARIFPRGLSARVPGRDRHDRVCAPRGRDATPSTT